VLACKGGQGFKTGGLFEVVKEGGIPIPVFANTKVIPR
jgi:hypothetical protein